MLSVYIQLDSKTERSTPELVSNKLGWMLMSMPLKHAASSTWLSHVHCCAVSTAGQRSVSTWRLEFETASPANYDASYDPEPCTVTGGETLQIAGRGVQCHATKVTDVTVSRRSIRLKQGWRILAYRRLIYKTPERVVELTFSFPTSSCEIPGIRLPEISDSWEDSR